MTRSLLPADFHDAALRLPVWSGMAQEVPGDTAAEKVRHLDYTVREEPIFLAGSDEPISTHKAVVVSSRSNPQARKTLAVVSADYHSLLPEDDGALLSRHFHRPPDAMGVMGGGIGLWSLYALGRFSVKGDAMEQNLLYISPKNGRGAVMLRLQPLRIVCSNAITMSSRTATATFRFVHDAHVRERTDAWLEHLVAQVPLRQRLLQEEFNVLSDTRVPDDVARRILSEVYPEPQKPAEDGPPEEIKVRLESWEQRRDLVLQRRDTVFDLYQGRGTGLDRESCKGTAFGVLAAVTEMEDFGRSHSPKTRGESAMFGARSLIKSKAYALLIDLARSL